ncbi:MAG: hypothetical protein KC466_17450 [Myxococcales bacterium]|nr:hypothetical protein [Myxococcales bacterium]
MAVLVGGEGTRGLADGRVLGRALGLGRLGHALGARARGALGELADPSVRARGITVVLGTYPATILPDITPCIDDPSLPLPQGLSQEQADFVNLFLSETNVRIRAVVAATPGTELVEVGNLAFPPNEFADCLHKNNLGDQREVPFWVAHAP